MLIQLFICNKMESRPSLSFFIDRGGTFTDVLVKRHLPSGERSEEILKLLSVDPQRYSDPAIEAIRRTLSKEAGAEIPRGSPLSGELISSISMGTTVATNAFLEKAEAKRSQAVSLAVNGN